MVSFNRQQKSPYSFLNISISIRTDNLYLINNKNVRSAANATTRRFGAHSRRFVQVRFSHRRTRERRKRGSQFPFRAFLGQRNDIKKEDVKQKGKRKGRTRKRRLSRLVRKRERENETFIPRSTRSNSCWRRLIFFLFFSPTALSGMDKIFVSFSQNTHKISLSLSNATI